MQAIRKQTGILMVLKTKQNKNKMINPEFYTIKNVFQNKEKKKRNVVSDRHPRLTQRIRDLEK